jgi:predicted NBD/HSP70 family sugar kinase
MSNTLRWGIDLGGTKVEGVVIDAENPTQPVSRLRLPTEADKGYEHIVNQIVAVIEKMQAEVGSHPEQVGIGTPGTLDPLLQTMKNSNTTVLNGRHLKEDLEKKLGIPLKMANDANCFALAEATLGAVPKYASGAEVVIGTIMGTGVGSGIVVNGKVLNGRQGIAGEWGHNFLDTSGGACYCGQTGCVETILSGTGLQKFYTSQTGKSLPFKEIFKHYQQQSDAAAIMTVERLIHFFGKAYAVLINIMDPDVIVIGGGIGNIDLLYTEGVAEIKKYIFNPRLDTIFLRPELGDSAGVFGAAMLCN